jgi:hypothetical protein
MRPYCLFIAVSLVYAIALRAGAAESGADVYKSRCAHCHGDKGEGSNEHPEPLIGDKSTGELARVIAKTMPKDDDKCSADEAKAVAEYISDAFYSPTAQFRNKPPRIELARLTVRQYRNAVMDLISSFRGEADWGTERGLHGEYYKSRRLSKNEKFIDRTDGEVNFDFGEQTPDPSKHDGNEFSIRWEGSVRAPETGHYDFIIRTEHAMRFWVNDNNRPLIDATVKSGSDNEYVASMFLIGGRAYPLKLEFIKAKQGVDDSKKNMPKPSPASIKLLWKLPKREPEVIPARHLSTKRVPEAFVVQTPFPPDDRSVGYERGSAISKEWDSATTDAALEVADFVNRKLNELAFTKDGASDREVRLKEFCAKFTERAFRRPLTDEQRALYIDRQFQEASDQNIAVKRVVLAVLKSPRFLFQQVPAQPNDPYVIAERISLGLWDSLPDQKLREAAAQGKLSTPEEVRAQVERMAKDARAEAKLREFFTQWLRLDHMTEISKDPKTIPDFNPEIATDLRTSLDLAIDEVLTSDAADFRQLLQADEVWLNGRLAKFYGVDLPEDAPFTKVVLDGGQRAGVLSHPLLMSGFAYTSTSSPIHRGVFIARSVLGRSLKAPPEAVSPLAPDLHADLNTRERVALQTKAEMCQGCHGMINPLGFAFERFDAAGRLRNEEKGRPVDVSGWYESRAGEEVKFTGVRQLADYLASSQETHNAFATQLFHYLVKQPVMAYGPEELPMLRQRFAESQFNIRRLMVEIVASAAVK